MSAYIYLIQEEQNIDKNVYTLGKFNGTNFAYPVNSNLILQIECNDCDFMQRIITDKFKKNFSQENNGFCGNKNSMTGIIFDCIKNETHHANDIDTYSIISINDFIELQKYPSTISCGISLLGSSESLLVNFGDENINFIDKHYIANIIKSSNNILNDFIKCVHFNDNFPQFRNVLITGTAPYFKTYLYENNEWTYYESDNETMLRLIFVNLQRITDLFLNDEFQNIIGKEKTIGGLLEAKRLFELHFIK